MLRSIEIPSRFVMVAVVSAFFCSSEIAEVVAKSSRPGECPGGLTSELIDQCFIAWSQEIEFDPATSPIWCQDEPRSAAIDFVASQDASPMEPFVFDLSADRGVNFLTSYPPVEADGGVNCDIEFDYPPLTTADSHICRAEVLRSYTWRLLCAWKVDRSPR